jgi:hypothetical protein
VIYGWVHRSPKNQSPEGTREILPDWKMVACPKRLEFQAFPMPPTFLPSPSKPRSQTFPRLLPPFSKPFQGVPSLSKPFFRKKRLFIFHREHWFLVGFQIHVISGCKPYGQKQTDWTGKLNKKMKHNQMNGLPRGLFVH